MTTIASRSARSLLPLLHEVLYHETEINVVAAAVDAMNNLASRDTRAAPEHSDVDALMAAAKRFPDEPYLTFAIEDAIEKIEGEAQA